MKNDLPVKNGIVIPGHEIEVTASRSGGAGGQHVNKTDTKITLRWNVSTTVALSELQKERVMQKLENRLTKEGELVIQCSTSRSQQRNKEEALLRLVKEVRKALYISKKRMKTRVPKGAKEARLRGKAHKSSIKKLRSKKSYDD
jgi:ribosome-associated protein